MSDLRPHPPTTVLVHRVGDAIIESPATLQALIKGCTCTWAYDGPPPTHVWLTDRAPIVVLPDAGCPLHRGQS